MVAQVRAYPYKRHQEHAAPDLAEVVTRETPLVSVLQCIVDLAREVVTARCAALAITDESGQIVRVFSSGAAVEDQWRIDYLGRGYSVPGQFPETCGPLPLPDLGADLPAVEFLPGHPHVQIQLAMPVRMGERVFGSLYLAERRDREPFTADDAATMERFAAQAAATIQRELDLHQGSDEDVTAAEVGMTYPVSPIDRSLACQRVEEQRDQLRIILDSLPAGILMLSGPDGRIEMMNRALTAMLFGATTPPGRLPIYSRDVEVLRANGSPLPHEEGLSCRALRGEEIRNQQLLLVTSQDGRVPVLVQAMPLPDASGQVTSAVLVFQDITRLRDAEQLKDDFLSLVSHEFRTPLTTIHGGAHLLMNQGEDLDLQTRRELLSDIVEESDRLDRMLANMLVLTEVMAGRPEARQEPLPLEQLVRTVATSVAARTGIHTFVIDIDPDLPAAQGDAALLTQVLSNLYQNAVKYSPEGGKILTRLSCDGHVVAITISDDGIGILDGEVDRVFDRFYRAGANPAVNGSGLGLYLSRHLVEVQGGQISAGSPGLGNGAAFTVTLPTDPDWMSMSAEEVYTPAGKE